MSAAYILDQSIDLMYCQCNMDGDIKGQNELFKQFCTHIKPTNFADIIVEADRQDLIDSISAAKRNEPNPVRVYLRTRQKTGADRYVVWNIYSISGKLSFIGVTLYDVSSVSAHEHERLKVLLKEVSFIVAHEIRQPLTSIMSLLDLMNAEGEVHPEYLEMVAMANDSAKKIDEVVKALIRKLNHQI